jgi:DHA2 family multidrug resistance protein-like MFS transporter
MRIITERGSAMQKITKAGRREWIGLAVLSLPTLLLALDFSVLYLALPSLGADLHANGVQLLWISDIYGFLVAGFLVTMGTLGDRIGRRRLLLTGAAGFAALSVVAAYSTSAEMLIVVRGLLGIVGATIMPSTLALISNMFRDSRQRATAISLWATCLLGGVAVGPVVGGVLLESFWWGSAFLLGVPVMLVLLVVGPALLPEYRNADRGRLDPASVALSLAAILPFVYGLKELAKSGADTAALLGLVAGAVFGVAFVRRQRRLASPLLDLRLFADRAFGAALGILLLGATVSGGIGFLFTQYLQLVEGLSPLRAGVWLMPYILGMIVGSLLCPVVARRVAPGYVIAGGLGLAALGFLLLTQVPATGGRPLAVIGLMVVFFGIAPTWVLGTDLVVGSAPPERAGSASALSETSSEFGVALGVAVLGSIGAAVYRSSAVDSVPAGALPSGAADAARDSIVGATAAAAQLPDQLGATVLDAARDAFTSGFNVAAAVAAPAALGLAVLALALLRHVRPSGAAAATEEPPAQPATAPSPVVLDAVSVPAA